MSIVLVVQGAPMRKWSDLFIEKKLNIVQQCDIIIYHCWNAYIALLDEVFCRIL